MGFPGSLVGKESTCNAGVPSSIPGSERSAGEASKYPLDTGVSGYWILGYLGTGYWVSGYPLQYSWASLVAQLVKNPPAMRET